MVPTNMFMIIIIDFIMNYEIYYNQPEKMGLLSLYQPIV